MKRIICLFAVAIFVTEACKNTSSNLVSGEKKDSASLVLEASERRETTITLAVADIVDAYNTQHFIAAFKDYSPDVIDYGDGTGRPIKGIDSVRKLNLEFFGSFTNFKGEDVHIAVDGDLAMVWAKWSATWSKDFSGQKATGKSFHVQDVDVFKFNKSGKIIEHHSTQPLSSVASQVGMKF